MDMQQLTDLIEITPGKTVKYDLWTSAADTNTPPIVPELAVQIGLNESLMLLQIARWIWTSGHEHDGHYWICRSVREMRREAFPYLKEATIYSTIASLRAQRLIFTRHDLNKYVDDHTPWFALNPEGLANLSCVTVYAVPQS